MLIDSHCHLDFPELSANLTECLAAMDTQGVSHALCAGVTLERHPGVLAIVEPHARLFASVGVHPEETGMREPSVDELVTLAAHPKVIAIGETGLDYYWHKDAPEWQRERFRTHIRAARLTGKPLVIHTRSASEDTLAILREEGEDGGAGSAGGVFHCFTESAQVARAALDMGFYVSFSGIITFKSAQELREVAAFVPLVRMAILAGFTCTLLLGGWATLNGQLEVGMYSVLVFMTQRLLWPLTEVAEVLEQAWQVVQGGVADLAGQQLQYVIVLLDLQQVAAVRGAGEAGQGVAEQFLDPLGDGLGAVAAEAAYLQAWPAAVGRQRVEVVAQAVEQGVGAFVAADHQLVPAVQADLIQAQHQVLAHAGIAQGVGTLGGHQDVQVAVVAQRVDGDVDQQ